MHWNFLLLQKEQSPSQVETGPDSKPGPSNLLMSKKPELELPSPEGLIKHPLQNKWALWFYKNDKSKDWIANLKLITAFDTVEDFWA